MTQARVGWRAYVSPAGGGTGTDTDAQAFITAAAITDSVQVSALNTLVTDLKTYGLWTKMKALYPFVGGSAASHKFNLKDPRDLDAAYRLVFNGGWTHTSTGAQPNGTTGYADTKLAPSSALSLNSTHVSYYSRTNNMLDGIDFGVSNAAFTNQLYSYIKAVDGKTYFRINRGGTTESNIAIADSRLFYMINRNSPTQEVLFTNTTKNIFNYNSTGLSNYSIFLGSTNFAGTPNYYGNKESAFVSIGDGLTDTEAANFYTSVQKFQTTLGRHVGTPYVSDADAISFLMVAGITDSTQAAAINTLVIRMKADGVWTKMKAIYPFVGGTANSHKWNLKDPRDLDAAYRLVFYGGMTHTNLGMVSNYTTSYASTNLTPSTALSSFYSQHVSVYSQTSTATPANNINSIGEWQDGTRAMVMKVRNLSNVFSWEVGNSGVSVTNNDGRGFYLGSTIANNSIKLYKDNTNVATNTSTFSGSLPSQVQPIGKNENKTFSFATIGDGLTDTDASNFYTAVQAYQTTLGRQVNVPLVSDTDAQSFLNATNITSFQQASAVNKLVIDLKAAGVWTKMKAIYPFVGGSATSHKWNLKDPRDLDAAYRLVFFGGGVHTSTGYQLNGSNSWANTYFTPSVNWTTPGKSSFGLYSTTTNTLTGRMAMGVEQGNGSVMLFLNGGGSNYALNNTNWGSFVGPAESGNDKRGFFQSSRNNSTTAQLYNRNNNNYSANSAYTGVSNIPIYIGTLNGSANGYVENTNVAFAYIGEDLSATEMNNYYTAVQTYQTSLGRSVNTPVYNNGLVLNLDAGNANSYPGTGTTWFDLASGNNGTLTNGPTYDTANGGSLSFSINKYVTIPTGDSYNFGTSDFTIEGWVNFNSITGPNDQIFVSKFTSWTSNLDFVFRFSFATPRITFLAGDLSAISLQNSYNITINTWYNYCVSRVSGVTTLYLNGIAQSSHTGSVNIPNDKTDIRLGYAQDNSEPLNGRMSGFKVYNRGLSSTEILNNFNSTRGRFGL